MYYGVEAHVVFVGKRDFCTLVVWQVGRRILGQLVLVLSGQLCVGSGGLVLKMVDCGQVFCYKIVDVAAKVLAHSFMLRVTLMTIT